MKMTWIDFYQEFATALIAYKGDRDTLIEKMKTVYKNAAMNFPKMEKDGSVIDIDPFTIFSHINKGITNANRLKIINAVADEFGIKSAIPTDFDGVPLADNRQANFFWFEESRGENDIDNLWDMFSAALDLSEKSTAENIEHFVDAYDTVMDQSGIKWNITMGLFWIRPYTYLNLDGRNRWFVNDERNMPAEFIEMIDDFKYVPTGEEYLEIVKVCKEAIEKGDYKYKDFPELSYYAFTVSQEVNEEQKAAQYDDSSSAEINKDTEITSEYWPSLEEYDPGMTALMWADFLVEDRKTYSATLTMLNTMKAMGGEATCNKLGEVLGESASACVSRGSTLGKRAKNKYGLPPCFDGSRERFYTIPFVGREVYEDGKLLYAWKLRPELETALGMLDMDKAERNKQAFKLWFKNQVVPAPDSNAGKPYSPTTINTYVNRISAVPIEICGPYETVFEIDEAQKVEKIVHALADENYESAVISAVNKYVEFLKGSPDEIPVPSFIAPVFETGYDSDWDRNRIIFGAPGTGKSFTINKEKDELLQECVSNYERVTFHPDYSYANFVGTYKPVPCEDFEGKDSITYEYVPGPFMRTLVKALKSGRNEMVEPYLLIIEEINRANVAAVFGDVFQLLDRDDAGVSEYPIQVSEDIKAYLVKELGGTKADYNEIKIPDNMFIWASMNSADQGVFPMDTAFKRRWDFTYIGINDSEEGISGKKVVLGSGKYECEVEWNELRKAINSELLTYKVNEDKLMGPYFISKKVLGSDEQIDKDRFVKVFKNKVLMYLFDDAAKQKRPSLFAGCSEKNLYSAICEEFEFKGINIFAESIRSKFATATEEDE